MPILHKNWEVLNGETLNFNIDYRQRDEIDPEQLDTVSLVNYRVRVPVKRMGQTLFELTENNGIYKDALEGHIEITFTQNQISSLISKLPIDYSVYLDNIYDINDRYAILRGRIKVMTNA